ncbi:MAG: hypothetical protein AVDCRST_MAG33-3425 [uncultured Thermomicrobiales bacterium]|uniref:Uncharacterized protein n=1 Tax=uncultured Thermomicrobiales bacterium TaxID=1645740 RepID=A0A6J4VI59_9BACT|nr:MAG: hypothetical protein AVDCRST_MAG33-3425 [uncultured Thermomicrobiales bacterium]
MSDDHSAGDGRKKYADIGGPEARHAQTHDVGAEQRTNPTGPEPYDPSFDEQLAPNLDAFPQGSHADDSTSAADDKTVQATLSHLDDAELSRLSVLDNGTQLQQGAVYLDLNDMDRGAFKAIGGTHAEPNNRLIAKAETDYEMWNRLVGQNETVEIDRP